VRPPVPACIDRLADWVLGLPWVVERPEIAEAPGLRWFAVDCEPLGRRRVWLLIGALSKPAQERAPDDFAVHVVLPTPAARWITDTGEGSVLAPIGVDHHLVSLELDATRVADDARVEATVLLGYEDSFM
jgi:hypothetical protein